MTDKIEPIEEEKARFGVTQYKYGGTDALLDLRSRVNDYQTKIKYSESFTQDEMDQFKYDLATTYNPEIVRLTSLGRDGSPASNEEVEYVQKYLKYTGHYDGEVDGLYGNKTKAAYISYSDEHSGRALKDAIKQYSKDFLDKFNFMKE